MFKSGGGLMEYETLFHSFPEYYKYFLLPLLCPCYSLFCFLLLILFSLLRTHQCLTRQHKILYNSLLVIYMYFI